jgi:biotin/methionine sulfoxide reductase
MPLTSTHWGTYEVSVTDGRITSLSPFSADRNPSKIGPSIKDLLDHPTRIKTPCIRRAWLEGIKDGTGAAKASPDLRGLRGRDAFVAVSWDEAEKLVAGELDRVRKAHGNKAIYAGSYGWASAGRFHHAQSQIHRFLNSIGGYTRSVDTYSYAAAEVIVPHVLGGFANLLPLHTSWRQIADHCELFVAFGGLALANGQMGNGGTGDHIQRDGMIGAANAGVEFVNISPRRLDVEDFAAPSWMSIRPNADTALILALCHTLRSENLADTDFLARYAVGYDEFGAYLDGTSLNKGGDGIPKTAEWASELTGIDSADIRALAREMAAKRTMVSISWSLTRQEFGEQPYWAAISLAAMLGQIGTPGGGIGFGYAIANYVGNNVRRVPYAALPQGKNNVADFIPVARISDMLLNPGGTFSYNGTTQLYPDVRLVYWAGGNPFHHHQDINRLRAAWARPETIIVHDWCWNAAARHADIVLPCTTSLEREDIGLTPRDPYVIAMAQAIKPVGEARDDYEILCGIARHLGVEENFSEGRSSGEWVRWLWDKSCKRAKVEGVDLPDYENLVAKGYFQLEHDQEEPVLFSAFRADPDAYPLKTPSGKIELFSSTVAGFGLDDCPGHATWNAPSEWLGSVDVQSGGKFPLHMIGKQPASKLHSQLDPGAHSSAAKIKGHEAVEVNPQDARDRGLSNGDIVRVFNDRGACLCGVAISDALMRGVVVISTGAWYDPLDPAQDISLCKHGNPNMLTHDRPTSRLAQGPAAHSCLVEIEAYDVARLPVKITAHIPPEIIPRG